MHWTHDVSVLTAGQICWFSKPVEHSCIQLLVKYYFVNATMSTPWANQHQESALVVGKTIEARWMCRSLYDNMWPWHIRCVTPIHSDFPHAKPMLMALHGVNGSFFCPHFGTTMSDIAVIFLIVLDHLKQIGMVFKYNEFPNMFFGSFLLHCIYLHMPMSKHLMVRVIPILANACDQWAVAQNIT